MVQWFRHHTSNAGGPGSIPGWGTGFHMPQLKVCMSQLKVLCASVRLCDPTDCSLSGSSVYGIFQARGREWIAISFSRGSSRPRNWTQVSRIAGRLFTVWATREASSKEGSKILDQRATPQKLLFPAVPLLGPFCSRPHCLRERQLSTFTYHTER